MKNVPSSLSNLESKVDKVDVDKLVPVAFDLSKLSDVVKNDIIKKDVYNPKIKNIEDKIPDITLNAKINEVKNKISNNANLVTNDSLNAKINKFKYKISSITNLATNTALTDIQNKILSVIQSKKVTITQKLLKLRIKLEQTMI